MHVTTRACLCVCMCTYFSWPVTGVDSKLNSATGMPLIASRGAKEAAGYTTDEVPT